MSENSKKTLSVTSPTAADANNTFNQQDQKLRSLNLELAEIYFPMMVL